MVGDARFDASQDIPDVPYGRVRRAARPAAGSASSAPRRSARRGTARCRPTAPSCSTSWSTRTCRRCRRTSRFDQAKAMTRALLEGDPGRGAIVRQTPARPGRGLRAPPLRRGTGQDHTAVRASLFITCFNDTLFPETGRATVRLLERLGVDGRLPAGADLLRADALQLGLRARRPCRWCAASLDVFADSEVVVAPSASCVGMVRELYPRAAELSGRPRAGRGGGRAAPARGRALGDAGRPAGRRGRRRLLPPPRDLPPDLPQPAHPRRRRPRRCACCARSRGIDLVELPEAPGVLRLRGHVRGQERRHLGGDAHRQGARDPRHRAPRSARRATTRA